MLIEYKIKFEQDGVTITQRVEPDSASETVDAGASSPVVAHNSLGASFSASQGGAGNVKVGPGGAGNVKTGPGGAGNIPTGPGGAGNVHTGPGGAGNVQTGPGGGANGAPVIVFGPIIIGASAPAAKIAEPPQQPAKVAAATAPVSAN